MSTSPGTERASPPGAGSLFWLVGAVGMLAVQQASIRLLDPEGPLDWLRPIVFVGTTLAVVAIALRFRTFLAAWFIVAGILLNAVPMLAHGGNMPVAWETVAASGAFPEITADQVGSQIHNSKDILLHRADIQFEPLSDRIVLDVPGYRTNIYSVGDLFIFGGVAVAALEAAAYIFGFALLPALLRLGRPLNRAHAA